VSADVCSSNSAPAGTERWCQVHSWTESDVTQSFADAAESTSTCLRTRLQVIHPQPMLAPNQFPIQSPCRSSFIAPRKC